MSATGPCTSLDAACTRYRNSQSRTEESVRWHRRRVRDVRRRAARSRTSSRQHADIASAFAREYRRHRRKRLGLGRKTKESDFVGRKAMCPTDSSPTRRYNAGGVYAQESDGGAGDGKTTHGSSAQRAWRRRCMTRAGLPRPTRCARLGPGRSARQGGSSRAVRAVPPRRGPFGGLLRSALSRSSVRGMGWRVGTGRPCSRRRCGAFYRKLWIAGAVFALLPLAGAYALTYVAP